ncbi:MAG: hypothetical protein OEQ24_02365 [Gammaproteobacteria bacterium]|nr:hypothetical protein [Gammaproteobacteria bacterium]
MSIKTTLIIVLGITSLFEYALAGCNKEDIQFYLDKGFTQEQITQLCATGSESNNTPDYQPYQQKVIIYSNEEAPGIKDGFTREERKAIKELQLGADVRDLSVDQDHIKFRSVVCLAVQDGKEIDQRYKTCPDVDVVIDRVGLSAAASGKKFGLFGNRVLQVQGNIKRTLVRGEDQFPAKYRQKLILFYKHKTSKPKMNLPIRGDYSTTKLYDVVSALSKSPEPGTTLAQNTEEETEPTISSEEKPKKKKRWWNPFD